MIYRRGWQTLEPSADLRPIISHRRTIVLSLVEFFGLHDVGEQKRLGSSLRANVKEQGRNEKPAEIRHNLGSNTALSKYVKTNKI